MAVEAKLRRLRIAPRKVRMVADLVRRKSVLEAQAILHFTVKGASAPMLKLLNSAVASAKLQGLDPSKMYVAKITVDEGQKLKRWRARARGRAAEIQKKSSHITLVLSEQGKTKAVKSKSQKHES